jgi:Domain of unknown function (DUF4878)
MKKIVTLVCISIWLLGCNSNTSSPSACVNSFLSTMKTGNIEELKKLITKSDLSLVNSAEQLASAFGGEKDAVEKMKKEVIASASKMTFTVKDEKIEGDKATVNVDVKEGDKNSTKPFKLIKEDGKWKIELLSTGIMAGANAGEMTDLDVKKVTDSMRTQVEKLRNINLDSVFDVINGAGNIPQENKDKMEELLKKLKEINGKK